MEVYTFNLSSILKLHNLAFRNSKVREAYRIYFDDNITIDFSSLALDFGNHDTTP